MQKEAMDELKNLHNPETSDTSFDHVLKYTGIFGGVQGLKMSVSVVREKLTAIILGSWGIGLITAYNAVFEFLSNASNMGIPLNATRKTSELFENGTEEQIEHQVMVIRTWVLWSAMLSVLICLFFSPIISYFYFNHDWTRWPAVMLTSLVAVSNIIAEGECAILKGLRQVRKVAVIETILALGTLFCTIPLYYLLGIRGVIVGLIACGFLSAIVHFSFSLRLVSYKVKPLSQKTFCEGLPLIKVGIPYVLAGVANSFLPIAIVAIILSSHSEAELGYYSAGWKVMVGYSGLVFLALESDYFPRLSAVNNDRQRMNDTINQQIDVCTLLITPMLILLVVLMPFVLQLLYKDEFLVVFWRKVTASHISCLRCALMCSSACSSGGATTLGDLLVPELRSLSEHSTTLSSISFTAISAMDLLSAAAHSCSASGNLLACLWLWSTVILFLLLTRSGTQPAQLPSLHQSL